MEERPIALKAPMPTSVGVSPLSDTSRERLVFVVLSVLIALAWLPRMKGPLDLRWDGAAYYVLGTALAEGKGYRLLNEPGDIEAVQYPPLLPAIVAAHQVVIGSNDPVIVGRWLRLSFFLIFVAYIFTSYVVLRQFLSTDYALLAMVLVILNLYTSFLSDLCFAEIPFGLATMVFVLCNSRQAGRLSVFWAALAASAAYLLRTAGIALLAAWVIEALLRRAYTQTAIRLGFALIPILGWHAYVSHVESSESYMHPAYAYQRADYLFYNVSYARNVSYRDPFSPELGKASLRQILWRVRNNLKAMPTALGEAVTAKQGYWTMFVTRILALQQPPHEKAQMIVTMFGIVVLAGLGLQLLKAELLIPLYVLVYLLAVCLTPWPAQWTRYWAPLAPFLALALLRSLLAIGRYTSHALPQHMTWRSVIVLGPIIGLILTVQVFTLYDSYTRESGEAVVYDQQNQPTRYRLFYYSKQYRDLDAALDWLRATSDSGDIIAASMPHWTYLRTGRKAVMPPFERDPAKAQELLDSVPVRYVVVDKTGIDFTRDYTLPLLRNAPQHWSLIYSKGDNELQIYQRTHNRLEDLGVYRH
jgi:hypothetical protein